MKTPEEKKKKRKHQKKAFYVKGLCVPLIAMVCSILSVFYQVNY